MKIIISESQKSMIDGILGEQNFFDRIFGSSGCESNEYTSKARDWKEVYSILVNKKKIKQGDALLVVWGKSQRMYYTRDGKTLIKSFVVSTGKGGFGNTADSSATSTGLLMVNNKAKADNKFEVIVGGRPTGTILGPNKDSGRVVNGEHHSAEVLTAMLYLDGKENGCNTNAASRGIYIHGTNREGRLGNAVSNGCIRVSNNDILYLYNNVSKGTYLYVKV